MYVHFHLQQHQKMPPVSLTMLINVKQCMAREIFLYFNGGARKKSFGTTAPDSCNPTTVQTAVTTLTGFHRIARLLYTDISIYFSQTLV
jgi:hypothetical protein